MRLLSTTPVAAARRSERAVRLDRRIAADPASAALLCSEPGAPELWPGVRRTDDDTTVVVVGGRRGRRDRHVEVRTSPPARTPTAFVCGFEVAEGGQRRLTGRLELAYDERPGGAPGTRAHLVLDPVDLGPAEQTEVARGAERFLANLARAAEARARVA